MRNINGKVTRAEFFYLTAYFLYIFAGTVISNSYLFGTSEFRHEITNAINYVATILFIISFIFQELEIKTVIKKGIIAIVGLLVAASSHSIGFGVAIMAIISAVNVDFNKITKCCIYANLFCVLIVFFPTLIGLVPDVTFDHNGVIAHSLGFCYYSNLPFIVFMLMMLIYLVSKTRIQENIVLLISIPIQYIVYKVCTVRLVFVIYALFLLLVVISRLFSKNPKHKFINFVSLAMFPAMMLFAIFSSLNVNNYSAFSKLNGWLNYRLGFNYTGFQRYGISLFGTKIITNAGYIDQNNINHYFYIDSGYAYSLLSYGILISVLLIILWSVLSYESAKENEFKMLVICIVVCIFSFVNNFFFNISLNPSLILAVNLFLDKNKGKIFRKTYQLDKFDRRLI